jgi:signal transduction histidine kinase
MLYLRLLTDEFGNSGADVVPLAEQTAIRLERALLASDDESRRRELQTAHADDPLFAQWAIHAVSRRLGRPVTFYDETAAALVDCLASELSVALTLTDPTSCDVAFESERRFAALVAKLTAYERRLANFDARLEREKLEALKELAYGASHEINNPLANIAARAQTLLQDESDPNRQKKLSAIHRQAMRAHEMIADLMLFARPPKLTLAPCDLVQIAGRVVNELALIARERDTGLRCEASGNPIELVADETQLAVAIHALIVNAIETVGIGGHVDVVVRETQHDESAWAEVIVRDDGPGISDHVRGHMFDPFFSGREAGRGLGFGLSKAWRIVTDHGGQVVVQRASHRGAEIAICLPRDPPALSFK